MDDVFSRSVADGRMMWLPDQSPSGTGWMIGSLPSRRPVLYMGMKYCVGVCVHACVSTLKRIILIIKEWNWDKEMCRVKINPDALENSLQNKENGNVF